MNARGQVAAEVLGGRHLNRGDPSLPHHFNTLAIFGPISNTRLHLLRVSSGDTYPSLHRLLRGGPYAHLFLFNPQRFSYGSQ